MKKVRCIYYETLSGRQPVKEFVDNLCVGTQAKFFNVLELLEDYGKNLMRPHAAPVRDGIYELRFVGKEGHVRILYFFYDGITAIFVHAIVKKTQKLLKKDIELAIRRKNEYFKK